MYVCGKIKYLKMKSKVHHKITFLPLILTSSLCSGYIQMNVSHTDTQHCGYFIQQVAVTKMNNIFHVCGEKKTTQPVKEQCYRLHNYTQNATGNLLFSLMIY
jgi:hypothetical protein